MHITEHETPFRCCRCQSEASGEVSALQLPGGLGSIIEGVICRPKHVQEHGIECAGERFVAINFSLRLKLARRALSATAVVAIFKSLLPRMTQYGTLY